MRGTLSRAMADTLSPQWLCLTKRGTLHDPRTSQSQAQYGLSLSASQVSLLPFCWRKLNSVQVPPSAHLAASGWVPTSVSIAHL